jgi:hypothetical protein
MVLLAPPAERDRAIDGIRAAWVAERDPELKMNWAEILLDVRKRMAIYDPRPCL